MKIHTPVFRGALTIAFLWIVIWGYLSFSRYQSEMEGLERSRFSTPDYLTDDCYASNFDFEAERLREPTQKERLSCLDNARESHTKGIASSKDFVIEQAWKTFLFTGVLPALGFLAIVAFWRNIIGGFFRVGWVYVNWLRFGSSNPSDKSSEQ